jgi:hypothetical protein
MVKRIARTGTRFTSAARNIIARRVSSYSPEESGGPTGSFTGIAVARSPVANGPAGQDRRRRRQVSCRHLNTMSSAPARVRAGARAEPVSP